MRRLFLGLLLAGVLLPTIGGCSTGCDLTPPEGVEVKLRTQLVGISGQTLRVVELQPEESITRNQENDLGLEAIETTLPPPTTAIGLDGSVITEPPRATVVESDLFDPSTIDPDTIIEIELLGSADELVIGEMYEIAAYSSAGGVVAVLNNGCRGADSVKNIDGSNIGGWGVGMSTAVIVGLLVFLPTAGAIGVMYVLRLLAGRRKGPAIKPGQL